MKFFGKKSVSSWLFYLVRLGTISCILLSLFILLSFAIGNYEVQDGRFTIAFPFISYFDIKGVYERPILLSIGIILFYISTFMYSLSLILKSFMSPILFSTDAIRYLKILAMVNLLVFPPLYIIMRIMILNISIIAGIHNLILSIIFGVFLLFVAAIFKRGLKVQTENDLTI